MSYRVQQSVVTCIFSWFRKWAPQPALYQCHDDTACGTWNSSLNITYMWSQWALVCADIQQGRIMDYTSAKLNTMLGVSLFHLHSRFYSYIWGLVTSICLLKKHICRAGKQPCPCPVEWDPRSTQTHLFLQAARITWNFTSPTCLRASISGTAELMGCVAFHPSAQCLNHQWGWPKLFWLATGQGTEVFSALQPGLER